MSKRKLMAIFAAVLGVAAGATATVVQTQASSARDLPSRADREQAANVVAAYAENGPYYECMLEKGWKVPWEWGINVAPALDNPNAEGLKAAIEKELMRDYPLILSDEFVFDMNRCRALHPGAESGEMQELLNGPPGDDPEAELAHWEKVIEQPRSSAGLPISRSGGSRHRAK